jgi:hypothetical protein
MRVYFDGSICSLLRAASRNTLAPFFKRPVLFRTSNTGISRNRTTFFICYRIIKHIIIKRYRTFPGLRWKNSVVNPVFLMSVAALISPIFWFRVEFRFWVIRVFASDTWILKDYLEGYDFARSSIDFKLPVTVYYSC